MLDVIRRRFEEPDETRVMPRGRFDVVRLGGVTVGRAPARGRRQVAPPV
jgi:hypothetical protein